MKKHLAAFLAISIFFACTPAEQQAPKIDVESISIDQADLTLTEGESVTLTATVLPEDAADKTVTWSSSNDDVVMIASNGKAKALNVGSAEITAKAGDKTDFITITVSAKVIPVTGISLTPSSITMTVGETQTITAEVTPQDATDKSITWKSSNPEVATVSDGTVVGINPGSVTITATTVNGGKTAECAVTIKANLAPSVTVGADHISAVSAVLSGEANLTSSMAADMTMGIMYSLNSAVLPSNSTKIGTNDISLKQGYEASYCYSVNVPSLTPNTTYYYRSYVNQSGQDTYGETKEFTTKEVASLLETKDASEVEATKAILNAKLVLTDVQYMNLAYGFLWGDSKSSLNSDLRCTEISGDAISASLTCLSHKTQYWYKAYAMLDSQTLYGEVKTFTTGVVPVESISLDKTEYTFNTIGSSLTLKATIFPEDATEKSVTWSSDKEDVATVGHDGLVTAVGSGTAIITAEIEGKTATCIISVYIPVESIDLSQDEIKMLEGQSKTLTATVNPSEATETKILWVSDHPEIASVEDGTVTALSKGQAIIIAYSGNISSSCKVNVLNEEDLELEKDVVVRITPSNGSANINGISYSAKQYRITNNSIVAIVVSSIYATNCNYYSYPKSAGNSTYDDIATIGSSISYTVEAGETMAFWLYYKGNVAPVATVWFKYNNKQYCISSNPSADVSNAVDMGLSVKWASVNLGASSPETRGDYYAWGETITKSTYSWSTYRFGTSASGPFSKYNTQSSYGTVDNKTRLDLEDDAARVKLGGKWRIPTDAEWAELREQCVWIWTTQNGVNGYKVRAANGNSIFLPAGGYMDGNQISADHAGYYVSSSLYSDYPYRLLFLFFNSSEAKVHFGGRHYGRLVRPVTE